MSVYRKLAANSIQKPSGKEEVSQTLLARIVRKVAIPKLLPNVILHFSILFPTKMKKMLEFWHVWMNIYKFRGSHSLQS